MVTWECQLIFSMRHRSYSLASLTQNHIEIAWSEISLQHCRAEKLSLGVVRYMAVFGWQALGLWAGWRGGKERGGGGLGWEGRGGDTVPVVADSRSEEPTDGQETPFLPSSVGSCLKCPTKEIYSRSSANRLWSSPCRVPIWECEVNYKQPICDKLTLYNRVAAVGGHSNSGDCSSTMV